MLIGSCTNPEKERRIAEILWEELDGVAIPCRAMSCRIYESERFSTTPVNASLHRREPAGVIGALHGHQTLAFSSRPSTIRKDDQ